MQKTGVSYIAVGEFPEKIKFTKIHSYENKKIFENEKLINDFAKDPNSPKNTNEFLLSASFYLSLGLYHEKLKVQILDSFCADYLSNRKLSEVKFMLNRHKPVVDIFKKIESNKIIVIPFFESDKSSRFIAYEPVSSKLYIYEGKGLEQIGKTLVNSLNYMFHSKRLPKFEKCLISMKNYIDVYPNNSALIGNYVLHRLLCSYEIVEGKAKIRPNSCFQNCFTACVLSMIPKNERQRIISFLGKSMPNIDNLKISSSMKEECSSSSVCKMDFDQKTSEIMDSTQSPQFTLKHMTGQNLIPAVSVPFAVERPARTEGMNDVLGSIICDLEIDQFSEESLEKDIVTDHLCKFLSALSFSRALSSLSPNREIAFEIFEEILRCCPKILNHFADQKLLLIEHKFRLNFFRNYRFGKIVMSLAQKYKINYPKCLCYKKIKKKLPEDRYQQAKRLVRVSPSVAPQLVQKYSLTPIFKICTKSNHKPPFYTG